MTQSRKWYHEIQQKEKQNTLGRTASIRLSCNRVTHATTRLIRAYIVREVVVKGTKLIGTIIAHPSTACSCRNGELNTAVYMGNTHMSIVFVNGISYTSEESKKREDETKHLLFPLFGL
jgi:hypothetical protein